jgi:hypothetical protein
MSSIPALVLTTLTVGICDGCSIVGHTQQSHLVAKSLGFAGCGAFGPLIPAQVVERNKKSGNHLSSSNPDWNALISKYASGDLIYYIDCRTIDASTVVVGTDFYALAREGVVIARALEVIYD